eukprot:6210734-Pleurochrysis_carterae.AAC.1
MGITLRRLRPRSLPPTPPSLSHRKRPFMNVSYICYDLHYFPISVMRSYAGGTLFTLFMSSCMNAAKSTPGFEQDGSRGLIVNEETRRPSQAPSHPHAKDTASPQQQGQH